MKLLKICGSLPLAIGLMAVLAAVLVPATCVETWYGSAAARFGFYGAWWFTLLCALLGVNILAALLVRFPWKKRQIGFVLAHLGMLALLVGCLLTRRHGVDASLSVFEGQAAWRAYADSLHFELSSGSGDQAAAEASVPFAPGPFNWGDYAGLSWFPWRLAGHDKGVLYDRDGVRLETLDYYADSQQISLPRLELLTQPGPASPHGMMSGHGGSMPLVLSVQTSQGPHGGRAFGLGMRRTLAGGQRVVFWMSGNAAETAAFRESAPDGPLGKKGRIVLLRRRPQLSVRRRSTPAEVAAAAGEDRLGNRVGQVRSRFLDRAVARPPRQGGAAADVPPRRPPRVRRARRTPRRVRLVLVRRGPKTRRRRPR